MKRYIKSTYTYDPWERADLSEWSDADIEIWNNTDWKARNYETLYVYDDSFEGTLYIYGLSDRVVKVPATFVKAIEPNTIYSPKYVIPDWWNSDIYKRFKKMGYTIYSPSCERSTHVKDGVTYRVADRSDTDELYDMLSR